jgi:hypothetical protein
LNFGDWAAEAGTAILTPTPPPPGVVVTCGSGKPGTPWSRIHEANRKGALAEFRADPPVLGEPGDEPQAAASSAREIIARGRMPGL